MGYLVLDTKTFPGIKYALNKEQNKLAKARKTRTSPSTLGLKKFGLGRLWGKKKFGSKKFLGQNSFLVQKICW